MVENANRFTAMASTYWNQPKADENAAEVNATPQVHAPATQAIEAVQPSR